MLHIQLATGILEFEVKRSICPVHELTGFAARNNPRRGFLFVSKVLGKHWPVRPSVMRATHRQLAALAAASPLPGPFFVVGMAETATALGRGFFDEFGTLTAMPGYFCHTTRYRLPHVAALHFQEEHSHATQHWLHLPQSIAHKALLRQARTLMLVDDEISTGITFCNMVAKLAKIMPSLQKVLVVTLLDMSGEEGHARIRAGMPCPVSFLSLLEGRHSFVPNPHFKPQPMAKSTAQGTTAYDLLPTQGGRTGLAHNENALTLTLTPHSPLKKGTVLVLGTGEFMYESYRLALQLEEEGREVFFQASTRSPILPGNDIDAVLSFVDNYGEHIDNFLYNVRPGHYDNCVIGYESPLIPDDHHLPRLLDAQCCFPQT